MRTLRHAPALLAAVLPAATLSLGALAQVPNESAAPALLPTSLVAPATPPEEKGEGTPGVLIPTGPASALKIGGYIEMYYAFNFNRPSNGISEFRAFDNRHNTIALQAAVADLGWSNERVSARVVLQGGTAPDTYYGASEPAIAGTTLTPAGNAASVRLFQQAYFAWAAVPGALTVDAGLFLSPVGPENMPTHQNFAWSHSLLYFALPFYHAGARVQWAPSAAHSLRLGVYNGWNNALDNNAEKTLGLDYVYTPNQRTTLGAVYLGGVERPTGAPEGRAWRNLFDVYLVWQPLEPLQLMAEADAGAEPNAFGLSAWAAGNAAGRVRLTSWLFAAARGTIFAERRATRGGESAAAIAVPADRIISGTVTLEARPDRHVSFKLEARRDTASSPVYFSRAVAGDGTAAAPFVPNAKGQSTITLGGTAWY